MATSPLVPGLLPVAIDGHAYQIDPAKYQRATVPVIRQQADTSFEPGESSLNPQGLWRRSQESWVHGAGQTFLDGRKGLSAYSQISQDPERFRSSKGLDCWTQGQISLLRPTLKPWATTGTNLYLAVAQLASTNIAVLYVSDGTEVYFNILPFGGINTLALQNGTGWTATNATISASGVTMFSLTATSAAAVSATSPTGTNGMPVDPGRKYGVLVESIYISGGAAKTPQVNVTWYTAAGAPIVSTTPVTAAGTDLAARDASDAVTAPSNAAFMSITASYTTSWANGEVHQIRIANAGPYEDLSISTAPFPWTSANINAGQAAQTVQSVASDGYHLWAALGTSGLHRTVASSTVSTADVPGAPVGGQISLVGYANGFLLAAGSATSTGESNTLWVVNDPMGTPSLTVIKTHLNSAFVWTGISPGRSCVYAYGNSGGNGEVYKILFDPNTGALATAASFATYLPDGETINTLQFYAGGIIMGTGQGLRLGTADGAGNIDYGPLVSTTRPVLCLEPQDRYVWFGLTRYDTNTSGLGRADLGFLVDNMTPAWASDLMMSDTLAGGTGEVVSAVTFVPYGYSATQQPPVRVFSVAGKGVYVEDPGSRVPSGQFQTGTIRYSTSEPKTTRSLDLRHHALPAGATITAEMQRDASGTWEAVGSSSTTASYGPAAPLDLLSETAEAVEFRFTLTRPAPTGTDYTKTPEMTRWTSKVLPVPSTIDETFDLAILMKEKVENNEGQPYSYPIGVAAEVAHLKALEQARTIVEFQVGDDTFTGYIEQTQFTGQYWGPRREYMEGEMLVRVQTVRG